MHVAAVERALQVLAMISQNEMERERHRSRLKARRDAYTALAIAHDQGVSEGEIKGQADKIQTLQRLLKQPITPKDELLTQSLDQLTTKGRQLEKLLGLE